MKNYLITKLLLSFCLVLTFINCSPDDESSKLMVTDFTAAELVKMHGGSKKSWKLTEVIRPEKYKDWPNLINNACVADDIYTFSASTSPTNESIGIVEIELGETRCFETISEAERFEGKLFFDPYKLNGVAVMETRLILNKCRIKDTINEEGTNGTFTICDEDSFRLVELSENRMVFGIGTYVGEYSFGFVFESIID